VSEAPSLEALLEMLRSIRREQEEILKVLRSTPLPQPEAPLGADGLAQVFPELADEVPSPPAPSLPVRRRRKGVLVIDDDPQTRQAARAAFEAAQIPVKTVAGGNEGLAAIAADKPDVVVLELGIAGDMPGRDVVNMIKATMEWVDIPIVLHTRVPIASLAEARTIHGADEFVPKDAPERLVSSVIGLFQGRGED
jgi:CheY-like chemotaxis protein